MYGAAKCSKCSRLRIFDLKASSSTCPYCNSKNEHKTLKVLYKDRDQCVARDFLAHYSGYIPAPTEKKGEIDSDPLSTLIFKYEQCNDIEEKLNILAKGLTEIYGEFTIEHVESIDPNNAEKKIKVMLETCLVSENKHGYFKS